jgi:hypothetical protein
MSEKHTTLMPISERHAIFRVLQVDLSYFFRTKWLIGTLVALNISDMLVAGVVYTNMMSLNYFYFFVPGVIVSGMFAAALDVGRRVNLGLNEGVTQYYLSLPVSLNGLSVAHIVSAGLGGTIYGSILLGVAIIFVPKLASPITLAIVPLFFIVSTGLGGIAAILNVVSKGGDRYWVFAQGVQMIVLGMSTVFYPISVVGDFFPNLVTSAISLNPLSQVANALRSVVNSEPISLMGFSLVFVTSLALFFVGLICYRYVFQKVWEVGKF